MHRLSIIDDVPVGCSAINLTMRVGEETWRAQVLFIE